MSQDKKRVAIVQFPGSNCEAESAAAIRRNGMQPEEFLWNRDPSELADFDGFFIVGGFSYEDRSRAGVLASLDPVLETVAAQADLGKPVLGICNGAQVLVESGLVPGLKGRRPGMALAPNRRQVGDHLLGSGFFNDWCYLRSALAPERTAFTRHLKKGDRIHIPFAHAEGRFLAPPELLEELLANGQGAFQYCSSDGTVDSHFPINPNGSAASLAAVTNPAGNIMAMMPHPERTPGGDAIFSSMREAMETRATTEAAELTFQIGKEEIDNCQTSDGNEILPISLIITDTTAKSVEQGLKRMGFSVTVERRILWEIEGDNLPDNWQKEIAETGELFNSNKEFVNNSPVGDPSTTAVLRVTPRDDLRGRRILETLHHRFHLSYPQKLGYSVAWILKFESMEARQKLLPQIVSTHIFHNPVADKVCERSELPS
ncbi:phosphoribosylformylglycinamidine synthase I [Puniceicoccus vermicola]|uniref:Phosphoribosylformylglycinamidine synthase I n=1 Tax=Puniceicoccus vermicola TaxID=388746 RepID=A0A7X1AYR6_9BACT|nr:phosphoribosylformylglycinamidine synthase I [Puniceicoccus vermicola]MBC2602456.1 phosphoribosylformylglycinamidine synthase I [Puniceicoccus vermicola]